MVDSISGGIRMDMATQRSAPPPRQGEAKLESASGALPETASPFDIALQIQDVQVKNFKRALDAQKIVLDLLA